MEAEESLIEFPCEFPIKMAGPCVPEFHVEVKTIMQRHVPNISDEAFSVRESRNGRFASITVIAPLDNRPQLDQIYKDLTDSDLVLWAL